MKQLHKKMKLSKLLFISSCFLKEIYDEIEKDFSKFIFKDDIIFTLKDNFTYKELFKKNFFTLLMLSLFLEAKIEKQKIISYGKIIVLLRQIVTSTDNILDNEEKGTIIFKTLENIVVKNSFLSLICQDLLTKECLKVSNGDLNISNSIFKELYSIAFSENLRDCNLYKNYPSSEYILNEVHSGIGGKLLEISLVVPKLIEKNSLLQSYSSGLYKIGMSLQALDDLFDIREDIESSKINLALSVFLEKNSDFKLSDFKDLDSEFKICFLKNTIKTAYDGFSILRDAGFPMSESTAKKMLKELFKLRGLEKYSEVLNW